MNYIDLHTHTSISDGILKPEELIARAYAEGVRHLAITDHNALNSNLEELGAPYPDLELISASEISAEYFTEAGVKKEIHVVGLFLSQTEELKHFLKKNEDLGVDRTNKMLKALSSLGIEFDGCLTHEEFQARFFPERRFIGRSQLAQIAVQQGYASTTAEFMDEYLGDYGDRKAFVPREHRFASLETVVKQIHDVCGTAVLAHPMSYKMEDDEVKVLIEQFIRAGGDGMECYYSSYEDETRIRLEQYARDRDLLPSCASDFHGNRGPKEHPGHYPAEYLEPLRERHLYYKK